MIFIRVGTFWWMYQYVYAALLFWASTFCLQDIKKIVVSLLVQPSKYLYMINSILTVTLIWYYEENWCTKCYELIGWQCSVQQAAEFWHIIYVQYLKYTFKTTIKYFLKNITYSGGWSLLRTVYTNNPVGNFGNDILMAEEKYDVIYLNKWLPKPSSIFLELLNHVICIHLTFPISGFLCQWYSIIYAILVLK